MENILDLLIFLIPIYVANSAPVILGGGTPLDLGKTFSDGKRILGKGKTIRGFIGGVLAGTFMGGLIVFFYQLPYFVGAEQQFTAAFALSLGTMIGDSLGSFAKRRMKLDSGKPFWPDTVLFLAVALVFVYPFSNMGLYQPFSLIFFFLLTVVMHPLTNALANKFGLKKVPW